MLLPLLGTMSPSVSLNGDIPKSSTPMDMESTQSFLVGDLLWSKISGYPFWPCMVSYDPLQGVFSKSKTSHKTTHTLYHVQYFGDEAHHGWTSSKNVIPFEGGEHFDHWAKQMIEEAKKLSFHLRQKTVTKYSVAPARKRAWEIAVKEAEVALPMVRMDRIETFVFKYHMPRRVSNHGTGTLVKGRNILHCSLKSCGKDAGMPDGSNENKTNDSSVCGGEGSSGTHSRLDNFCKICEKQGANITCTGQCLQSFHLDCLGVLKISQSFMCDECISGKHHCFACNKVEGAVKKCSLSTCGKFYHLECLQNFPVAKLEENICPLHACLSCHNDNPKNPCSYRSRFVKCIRCPTAYHSRDGCIAAGSLTLSTFSILCPDHFRPTKGKPYQTIINITWCFICSTGGKLICCETCPAAFHVNCLNIDSPEGKYFCEECVSRKQIRYGSIVWVKIGSFRWWPAQILIPRDVPINIQNMKHSVGEFPIQYFGTKEYFWTHKGRVFPYSEEDKFTVKEEPKMEILKKSSAITAKYKKSLDEAALAFDKWAEAKLSEELVNEKPPPYKHIKVNKPLGCVQILHSENREQQCGCDPKGDNPCGYGSLCLNRSMLFECHSSLCKAGECCQNQMFQKRDYVSTIPFRSRNSGWGLKTLEDVKKGQFVIEYVGDLIDGEECRRRLKEKQEADDKNFYFLTLDKERVIDAGPRGNLSRFMNHSCEPNCETQKWVVNGDMRIGLFAICGIPLGSELTFDYRLDSFDNEKLKCCCGAKTCRGLIGEKPQNVIPKPVQVKGKSTKMKKRKHVQPKLKKENVCFLCKEPGTLVLCDRKGCTKAYHVSCLKRKEVPVGRWQCPWHHCDTCGRMSKFLCCKCPNSFCEKHKSEDNMKIDSGLFVCWDHFDTSDNNVDNSMDIN